MRVVCILNFMRIPKNVRPSNIFFSQQVLTLYLATRLNEEKYYVSFLMLTNDCTEVAIV